MRVLIDTSYARRGPSGTAVYVEQLVRALRERGNVEVVEAAQRRRLRAGAGNPLRSAGNALLDLAWLGAGLPRAARRARADVVHHPLPAHARLVRRAQVATLHDVAFETLPGGYGRVWRKLARRAYRRAARRSAALVCVSESTARDAVLVLGAEPSRVVVAPHGAGQVEGLDQPERERTHLLYVGDTEERKRVDALLAAYSAYRAEAEWPVDLVLAGAASSEAGVPGVRGVPDPSPAELVELYGSAIALVHPAIHEGFGLTVIEAMAAGTPVIAQRAPGTAEVGGDAVLSVGESGLAEAIARVAADAGLRDELSRRGRERAARFSWRASAQAHERAYTLACR